MILSFAFFYQPNEVNIEETNLSLSQTENVLFFGTGSSLVDIDPHNTYDSGSIDIVSQVLEGLFENDLSDPDLKVIPNLALNYGIWDGNRYTVELRQGVTFHDGTPFDAYAVKFSFDRLAYMIENGYAMAAALYSYYDYETDEMKPIINNVNVINDYSVEFELSIPYDLFESLLCFVGSYILSPSSTPAYDLIDTYSGDIVGTGPFTFEYFDPDVEVSLRGFDNYWKGKPDIDHLVFKFYYDSFERAEALLNNEIHMMKGIPIDYIDTFEADPNFIVDSLDSTTIYYVGMNNYWINRDLREAISYAIDYNYIIDELLGGQASRLRSPIPEGIKYSDNSFIVAETDIIHARTIMQSMGYGVGLDPYDDGLWESSTFLSLNYTYNIGNPIREDIYFLLEDNLGKIGIDVLDAGMDWNEFLGRLYEYNDLHREMTQLFCVGWGADYNDPSNYINSLFTNRTVASNGVNYNGYQSAIEAGRDPFNLWDNVQLLMEEALLETDPLLREQYYQRIQQILVEEDMPWAYCYVPIASVVYKSEIQGFQWNSMQNLKFYSVSGVLYEEPEPPTILILGTRRGLETLDPLNAWDYGSFNVIDQVAEGLFWYDFTDPSLPIIPKLAADYGTWDGNTYTVELKQGIQFHDGTPFNADAVKFTFDRLQYFMDNEMAAASDLYIYYDSETDEMKPIINNVNVINDYTVEFELGTPYGLFETLLSFEGSFILSPTSTPATDYIDTYSSILVGTGPFAYEYYDPDVEVSFRAFENYWDGEASIDYLKFRYIYDEDERADQLAWGDIHMILSPPTYRRSEFEGNPEYSLDSINSSVVHYLGMNNYWIDRDLREAISYAFDYDYMINDIYGGEGTRLRSPIPNSILYSDDSFEVATTNLVHARTIMQSMGYGIGFDLYDDTPWEASTFLSINYTYNIGNYIREQLFYSLEQSLGKIGIEVIDAGMDFIDFWNRFLDEDGLYKEMLQLFWLGWGADYNDPSNYIYNLFTNRTRTSNSVLYNGYDAAIEAGRDPFSLWDNIQLLMEAAITESDPGLREQYYQRIQQILVEEDRPWVFGYVPFREVWYSSEIQGFQWNFLEKLNFYGVSGVLYEEPEPEPPTILILGTNRRITDIDPLITWDVGALDVIDQVAEGLFGYDFSDPNLPIIPKLAADYGTWDGNTYTVELKQGVEFHDGTPFDAYAVKFTFDRLQYFMDNEMAIVSDLYRYYDVETDEMKPIINNVNVINDYTVEFELGTPYGLFETLLSYEGSFFLSPTSTPLTDYIDTYSGTLVGTGPFAYEYYDPEVEVGFRAFENYWNGEASIDYLKFRYIYDENDRADQLAGGDIHMILSPPTHRRGEFEGNPEYSLDSINSSTIYYLGMNNYWIDRDLREAISYAFDYDYLINDIYGGEGTLLRSPIPNGILYSDDSFNAPTTNLTHARIIMQSMGYGIGFDLFDDGPWEASTFLSINYTYNIGSDVREQQFYSLEQSLGKIGIEVLDGGMDIMDFWNRVIEEDGLYREMLQLFWIGWRADYNDPSNYINNLFTNRTRTYNSVLYNGYDAAIEAGRGPFDLWNNTQLLMEAAIVENDPGLRELYYARIQQLLVEEDMPWVYGYVPLQEAWYSSEIQGFQCNHLGKLNFIGVTGLPDTTPPITEITLDGMIGMNEWYISDVLVTLEATDDLSGVCQTGYSFDGVEWFEYTEPFLIEESKTIFYGSIDNFGNYEISSIDVNIDKDPPVLYVYEDGIKNLNLEYYGDVTINIEVWDYPSGVSAIYYSFDSSVWYIYTEPFVISDLGITDYYYYSIDNAGNEGAIQFNSVTITTRPVDDPIVIYGLGYDPHAIDPLQAWDTSTYAIIDQVVEGLFAHDLSDPNMAIMPRLAVDFGTWSPNGLSYTVDLRSDVSFHDGTPFNASAVEWTFDRMIYFMDSGLGYNDGLYRFLDGTPIISSVDVVDTYTVRFNLNRPFAGLESLLCFTGSAILSPSSTPATEFLDPFTDALVGTGPFELDTYIQEAGVSFVAFQDYWNGPANIDNLWYLFISDTMLRTEALLNGYIDFLESPAYSMLSQFESNPDFTILNTPSAQVNFLEFNNQKIDTVFRQAIAHAFDYDFIISMYPDAIRAESILSEGMLYSDGSSERPTFDVVAARQILLDNGIVSGLDPTDELAWTNLVDLGTPIATFNYTYNIGSSAREDMYYMLKDNLRLIGIELVEVGITWGEFIELLINTPERLELFYLGWIADFNDPYSVLNMLLSVDATLNFGLVDDPYLQSLMNQGMVELDPVLRQSIYSELQRYFMEELLPMLPILNPMLYFVHDSIYQGFHLNAFSKVWFYSVFTDITPPQTTIELDGTLGMNDWYISDVSISLFATDDISGVDYTEYSYNEVDWFLYTGSFVQSNEDYFTIYFRSGDNEGNVEVTQSADFKIDKTKPLTEVFLTGTEGTGSWYISDVLIEFSAFDATAGVSNTQYGYDGVIWSEYIDPLSFTENGVYVIYYRSIDAAGNTELYLIITFEIDKSPSAITDKITEDLEDLDVPPEAQDEVDKAFVDLLAAIEEFNAGEFYKGFDKIQNAIKDLVAAQDDGADTQSIIDDLVEMAQTMAENAINDAIEMVGEDNDFVIKAQDKYADALARLSQGEYDDAIRLFKNAFKNAMKARITWVPESYLDDLNDVLYEINILKNSGISSDAISNLILAEEQILLAIEDGLDNNIFDSFNRHIIAISKLEDTMDFGVDTTYIINMIMTSIKDVVFLKIVDAEEVLLGAQNDKISDAWDFYYLGQEEWSLENYESAILNYIQAIEKMEQALT